MKFCFDTLQHQLVMKEDTSLINSNYVIKHEFMYKDLFTIHTYFLNDRYHAIKMEQFH